MKIEYHFLIAFLIANLSVQYEGNNWIKIESGTNKNLSEVAFLGSKRGVIIGQSGEILITDNAGLTWQPRNSGTILELHGLSVADDNTLIAVGGDDFDVSAEENTVLLRTDDGGENWVKQQTNVDSHSFTLVKFITPERGIITSLIGQGDILETILTTSDGGNTWETFEDLDERTYHFYDVQFSSSDTGMIVGCSVTLNNPPWLFGFCDAGVLLTADGGATWTSLYEKIDAATDIEFGVNNTNTIEGISHVTNQTWIAVGNQGIFKTTNNGKEWTFSEYEERLFDVEFINSTHGTAVGSNGTILRTIDGGIEWNLQESETTENLTSISFTEDNIWIAVGNKGTILRSEMGASVTFVESTEEVPADYDLKQNYPNPFNPSTTIKFSLAKKENVKLTIYNTMGELVEILLNKQYQAGNHSFEFYADGLSSGVYFYTLKTSSFSKTKKMLLLK